MGLVGGNETLNENQKNRVIKLEEKQTATDQKKNFCSCDCHNKTIADYNIISDEKAERIAEIMRSQKYRKPDGSEGNMHEAWLEHHAKKPPCLCNH